MNFDERAKFYNKFRSADFRLTQKIIELLNLNNNSIIADIGAGTGNYTTAISNQGFLIYGVEPSENMINQCNNKNIIWVNSFAENIDISNNKVDGVIIINALHHFKDLKKVFSEVNRIMKHGPLIIFTFDPYVCRKIWLYDYWPEARKYIDNNYLDLNTLKEMLNYTFSSETEEFVFSIPCDFQDCFSSAVWSRPHLLLNSKARNAMSLFNYLDSVDINIGLKRLRKELHSGVWGKKYADIISCSTYDVGCRFLRLYVKSHIN